MTTPTKPTARERSQRILYGERGKPRYAGDPLRQLIHDGLEDAIVNEIEAAAQAAREEERRRCEAEIRKLRDECCRGFHEWWSTRHPLTGLTSVKHCAVCGVEA